MTPKTDLPAADARQRLAFSDETLLAECQVHTYRASGPGGQKRNKTSSAVRLHHGPTGLIAPAEESRSQHENKARALRRLRHQIALVYRLPPEPIDWPGANRAGDGTLRVSAKNPQRVFWLAAVLDAFAAHSGQLRATAEFLGVTSSSLVRFVAEDPQAWATLARLRATHGARPLKAPS